MKGKNCDCGCKSGIGKAIALGVIVLLVFGIGYMANSSPKEFVLNANANPQEHTISVSGEASKKVAPDELQLSFSIETFDIDPKVAEADNANILSEVKKALAENGIAESEIKTDYYSLYPEYETIYEMAPYYSTKQGNLTGYKTVHAITVKTEKLGKAGELVDAVVNAGVANINSISFGLKEETRKAIEEELLAEASANARDKAQRIAGGIGAALGKVVSVSTGYVYFPRYDATANAMVKAGGEASEPTQIYSDEISVSSSVSAVFGVE